MKTKNAIICYSLGLIGCTVAFFVEWFKALMWVIMGLTSIYMTFTEK